MEAFCQRAMPYMMADLTDDPTAEPTLHLGPADAPVQKRLGNGLVLGYLVDRGGHFEYVLGRHLEAEGLTREALHEAALANLVQRVSEGVQLHPVGDAFALILDGNFEASLLLLDGLWEESLAGYAPSGLVVAVPARDVLAFADSASPQGVEQLRDIVARTFDGGDHLLVSHLLRREAGAWVVSA